jgi:Protein of unknown function (DUF3501)
MRPITANDLLPVATYARVRPVLRPLFIAEKERRRLAVGEHLTLLFENAQTVWYQIQEMARAERIVDDDGINREIDTYNELLPKPGELSATLLIEYSDPVERDAQLPRLVGLEQHVWIVVDGLRTAARFDQRQMSPHEVSSVQFVQFPMGAAGDAERFLQLAHAGRIAVEVDHPHLSARAVIGGTLALALADDLRTV